jgi:zinc protease
MIKTFLLLPVLVYMSVFCPAQKPLPQNMFSRVLPNGLTVLVVEDNSVPLATIEIAVKNGAYTESPEFNGLSHLYEHMFFKANKDYRDQMAFIERSQELGIIFNGTTSNEKVNYYFTLPKYNLEDGLKLMNSAIQFPEFDKNEMKKENTVVDAEFQRHESNPVFALTDAMNHHLWGDLYSRKNPVGDHEIITSATPAKMQVIRDKYYWPNNSLLIVAGDVSHAEVFAKAEKTFGSWKPSGFDPFEKYPRPEMKPLEKTDFFVVESPNVRVPLMLFEWQGPDTRKDVFNTYVADIFSFILIQNASKLHKAMIESGLALQINVNYLTERYTGPISFFIAPNPSKVKECLEAFHKQLDLLDSDDYFTDDQLALSKRLYEIRKLRDEEETSEFVHSLSYWWCSASLDYFNTYLDNMNKVTREDIRNYVRKYIKDKPYCAGLLVNTQTLPGIAAGKIFKAQ